MSQTSLKADTSHLTVSGKLWGVFLIVSNWENLRVLLWELTAFSIISQHRQPTLTNSID